MILLTLPLGVTAAADDKVAAVDDDEDDEFENDDVTDTVLPAVSTLAIAALLSLTKLTGRSFVSRLADSSPLPSVSGDVGYASYSCQIASSSLCRSS